LTASRNRGLPLEFGGVVPEYTIRGVRRLPAVPVRLLQLEPRRECER